MTARDLVYGRQGGRIVSGDRTLIDLDTAPHCDLCGQPMTLGQKRSHLVCVEATGARHPQGNYPIVKAAEL